MNTSGSTNERSIETLRRLLEWYGSQEVEIRADLDAGRKGQDWEREWVRYKNEADALRAGIAALEQPSEPVAVSGWVIEGAWSPIDTPDYWVGSSAWSPDPYKALRFATSKDAQQAADMMCSGLSVRLCEHEWAEQPETKTGSGS